MNLLKFQSLPTSLLQVQALNMYVEKILEITKSDNISKLHQRGDMIDFLTSIKEKATIEKNYTILMLFNTISSLEDVLYKRDDKIKHLEVIVNDQTLEIENQMEGLITFKTKVDKMKASVKTSNSTIEALKVEQANLVTQNEEILSKFDKLRIEKNNEESAKTNEIKVKLVKADNELIKCQEIITILNNKIDMIENSPKYNTITNKVIFKEIIALKQRVNKGVNSADTFNKSSRQLLKEDGLMLEKKEFLTKISSIASRHQLPKDQHGFNYFKNIDIGFLTANAPCLPNLLGNLDLTNLSKNEKFAMFTFASNYLNELDSQYFASKLVDNIKDDVVSHVFDPVGCFSNDIIAMIAKRNNINLCISYTRNFIFDDYKSYNTFTCVSALTMRFFKSLAMMYISQLKF